MIELVRQPQFRLAVPGHLFGVFVFAGLLNFLPFELKALNPAFRETGIGVMYAGYVMGILVSLNVRRLITLFGSETRVAMAGLFLYIAGITVFMVKDYRVMFLAMFVFCTGMFMAHSLLSGYINTLARSKRASPTACTSALLPGRHARLVRPGVLTCEVLRLAGVLRQPHPHGLRRHLLPAPTAARGPTIAGGVREVNDERYPVGVKNRWPVDGWCSGCTSVNGQRNGLMACWKAQSPASHLHRPSAPARRSFSPLREPNCAV